MRTRQRLFALVAAFAVAFGSLWPLVSVAGPRSHEIPSFICSQSGFHEPGVPLPHEDKSHCPLCVMAAEAAPPVVVPAVAMRIASCAPNAEEFVSSPHSAFLAQPPPSRAPPRRS